MIGRYTDTSLDKNDYNNIQKYVTDYTFNIGTPLGAVKDYLLEQAKGDYVMFLSSNETLYSVTSLWDILGLLKKTQSKDMILLPVANPYQYKSPVDDSEDTSYAIRDQENDVSGKIFKTSFLRSKSIHFLKHLDLNEDLYFIKSILSHNPQYQSATFIAVIKFRERDKSNSELDFSSKLISNLIVLAGQAESLSARLLNEILHMAHMVYQQIITYPNEEYVADVETMLAYYLKAISKYLQIDSAALTEYTDVPNAETFSSFLTRLLNKEEVNE